ncbi:hypothetical protein RU86_GL000298 [Lactococcus piscium]|uniref:DUF1310 family protein n=2 Tax=Pseudolactococcus piscium TaxID=1364 RepID=A0A2A5RYM7_9LACT|nr:hypothetical protein RU86_GL000298 [Lactococcus piscium]
MNRQALNDEMVAVVKSDEAHKIVEHEVKSLDEEAFTPEGVIKSYEINYKSIKYNPMGSIMFDVIINRDSNLVVSCSLNKRSGILSSGGVVLSENLVGLTERKGG